MKKIILDVPDTVRYLSQWKEFKDKLPSGKIILNKKLTDTGGSHYFLVNDDPVILCSPRTEILYSKSRKLPNTYLFRTEEDTKKKIKPFELKDRLKDYIFRCTNPFTKQKVSPKILVTYDSFQYVAEVLAEQKTTSQYTVVVDEFQCIWTDAPLKGDTEVELVSNLQGFFNVIYLSATPYIEDYLDFSPEFSNMTYVELHWPNTIKPTITYEKMKSPISAITKIIDRFRKNGYFESRIMDGQTVYSREAVFFLNKVSDICSIIKKLKLGSDEVNVLCSDNNAGELKTRTGITKGHAPGEGEPHKTFTFCTRFVFEGTDFNSTNAYTYVFSDPNIDSLSLDISLDLHQILGRQRLDSNPFKYYATLYYKTRLVEESDKPDFDAKVNAKDAATDRLLENFRNADEDTKKDLIGVYRSLSDKKRFEKNYVSVIEDPQTHEAKLVKNTFVQMAEIRAWDIQSHQYTNTQEMIGTISNEGFEVKASQTGNTDMDDFIRDFRLDYNFPRQMKCYADFRDDHPELKDEIEAQFCIPSKFTEYYNLLGSSKLHSLCYREDYIKREEAHILSISNVKTQTAKMFIQGIKYTNSEVKSKLQEIYDSIGLKTKAKASDLPLYMNVRTIKLLDSNTNKRVSGYEIL